MENQKLNNINMTAKFSNFEVINKDFTRCRCNVMYTGRNRNYSDITDDALQKFITRKGYANIPVVAHIMKDDEGNYYIGSHDRKLIISNEGIDLIDETIPYGVIPEDCNPSMDLVTEKSGVKRNYFSVDIILWSHRYPIMKASYNDEIYFNQSMEVSFDSFEYDDDGYAVVHDFSMSALCLLNKRDSSGTEGNNKNQEPCFESSCVKKFSINESTFKHNFELMLEKLKEYESASATTALPVQNTEPNNNHQTKGENKMDFTKFTALLSDIKCEGNDCVKYDLLSADEKFIYVLDKENGRKIYSVEYVLSNDDPVINWKTKTEGDITFTEKSEDKDSHLTIIYNELNDELNKMHEKSYNKKLNEKINEVSEQLGEKYNKLQEKYDTLKESYRVVKEKLDKFEAKEVEKQKQKHIDSVKEILDRFEKKIGKNPEFIYFKAKLGDYEKVDLDKLDKDLTLMSGEIMINSSKNENFSYSPISTNVNKYSTENDAKNRYGSLLDGFMD